MHLGLHRRRDWTTIETFHSTCSKSENAPCTALAGTWISQLVQEQCTLFVQSFIDVQNLSVLLWATFHLATWPSSQLPIFHFLISRPMQLTKKGETYQEGITSKFQAKKHHECMSPVCKTEVLREPVIFDCFETWSLSCHPNSVAAWHITAPLRVGGLYSETSGQTASRYSLGYSHVNLQMLKRHWHWHA